MTPRSSRPALSRRHFLGQSGLGLLGTTLTAGGLSGWLRAAADRPAPSERITMGVIGCGGRGNDVLKNFLNDERVQVVAVCDVEKESSRYNKNIVKKSGPLGREPTRRFIENHYGQKGVDAYADFRELLAREDIDSVLIATPDHWHALIAVAAARAGKSIYCEKPLSLTVAEGRFMSDTVNAAGVVWQTGSQQRSDLHFRLACEMIRNGRLGKLKEIRVGLASDNRDNNGCAAQTEPAPVPEGFDYEFWLGPAPEAPFCPARLHSNWRWIYDYSGGNITDFGAHHLDIVQWALDRDASGPSEFFDLKATWPEPGSLYVTPTTFNFSYRYDDGTTVHVADKMDFGSGIQFVGEEGSITSVRGGLKFEPISLRQPIKEDDVHLFASKDHFRNFIDAIRGEDKTAAPIEFAHRSISIAHLANIALRLRRDRLRWDPATEQVIDDAEASAMLSRPMRGPWQLV
ncbi:MAG: Gfo/Idh/MocA family oxidoreductase [Verrucomicrobiales bacterium]|nr:Gfo/Idh/MocA family oxidoreductase [Verrucomicrobiales bacterium]